MQLLSRLRRPLLLISSLALLAVLCVPTRVLAHTSVDIGSIAMRLHPHYTYAGKITNGKLSTISCLDNTTPPRCYDPFRFLTAYSILPLFHKGFSGEKRTIVIIDAYQSPTIRHDLALFDSVFHLPDPKLNIIAPGGLTPFDPSDPMQVAAAGEISLDVEWAHTVAPSATIDLVLAKTLSLQDIYNVTKYVVDHNLGDVISQSFGINEICSIDFLRSSNATFVKAMQEGISLFAASGDFGAAQSDCHGGATKGVSYPASDPHVVAVGGTSLNADAATGTYKSEVTWNDSDRVGATGGGFSSTFTRPGYQNGVNGVARSRGLPDVAMNSDPETGVIVVWSSSGQGPDLGFIFGGTSASCPEFAALIVLADQVAGRRLGLVNNAIYKLAKSKFYSKAFHDITKGNNTVDINGSTITGYSAHKGWDPVTGWGSPIGYNFVQLLIANS